MLTAQQQGKQHVLRQKRVVLLETRHAFNVCKYLASAHGS